MKNQILSSLKSNRMNLAALLASSLFALTAARAGDPRTNCWLTTYSGQFARIYTNDAMKTAGTTLTTWSNGSQSQSSPAYDGVQDVYSSADWVYVRSTGLASYDMGPWYLNVQRTEEFPNLPVNQKLLYRFPRTNGVPATKTLTGAGQIGIFVDGVEMFNSWDDYYWNGSADVSAGASNGGYWNRDAYVNEGVTFDAGYAHQQQNGTFHYHADPIALRYLLGDHVDYNPTTKTYYEDTNAPVKHSPILAWTADGYPLYGPYGYSNPTNPASGIRRMVSGYVPRNGQNGTDNLDYNGAARSTIPAWAQRAYNASASQSGPTVSSSYPFGRYMEDKAYLGDLTNAATGTNYQQGVDFDLDEYNGHWCVTPEFPDGTYAYFVAIDSNGTPVFPYNIGRDFRGNPVGGSVAAISETVVTNFVGGPDAAPSLNAPTVDSGAVTLTWSATEGGTYMVESTTNFSTWTTNSMDVSAVLNAASFTNNPLDNYRFYRVARTALAAYDPVTSTSGGSGQTITLSPDSGTAGASFTVSATISASANPAPPPHTGAPVTTFTIGANAVAGTSYTYNADGSGTVTGSITSLTGSGGQTVTITFAPPQGQTQGPTYTQTDGFTVNP
jgi:hypothetical protein